MVNDIAAGGCENAAAVELKGVIVCINAWGRGPKEQERSA